MKSLCLMFTLVFSTILWHANVKAQSLTVLDDFSSRLINPAIWTADLERIPLDIRFIDAERGINNGMLLLRGRQYGLSGDNTDNMTGGYYGIRLIDRIGRKVDAIGARIKLDRTDSRYCENGVFSFAGTISHLNGIFVRDANATGLQGALSSYIVMVTLNPTPVGLDDDQYRIVYENVMCLDPECERTNIVDGAVLGDSRYGEWIDIEIRHDRSRGLMQFSLQSDSNGTAVAVPYPDSIVRPVAADIPNIAFATRTQVPECPAEILPRPFSAYEISIDRISVNPSALRGN